MNTAEILLDLLRLKRRLETALPAERAAIARAYRSQLITAQTRAGHLFGREYSEQQLLDWAESIKRLQKKRARR